MMVEAICQSLREVEVNAENWDPPVLTGVAEL